MAQRWGDVLDDSDDEESDLGHLASPTTASSSGGVTGSGGLTIPPTHKSRIDSKGIQIITSYRQHPGNASQLLKTITKVRVTTQTVKEPKAVAERRKWTKFGQALLDEKEGGISTTIQSKDEILLEDPNADTDLQEEDATKAIAGNLNEFWAKQQRRQLERRYDVTGTEGGGGDATGAGGAEGGGAGGGWTQVGSGGASAAGGGGGGAAGASTGKYIPPAARAGLMGVGGGGAGGAGAFKPERRTDDLNTIRVTNISENTTESDLQDLFKPFGRISRVYLAKDKETLVSRGFAFVSFVNKEDAAQAMDALQGFGYDHLILKLEWARPNAPKDPASSGTEFRSGYGKALAQDTKEKVSYASNLTKGTRN
jgi:translation initiation factor 3 subunit G